MSVKKHYSHFTKDDRNELAVLLKKGYSQRDIGDVLGKDHSSISRELNRNQLKKIKVYDSAKAHHKSLVKREKSKYQGMKIRGEPGVETYVKEKLKIHWTPEQIAGRWNREKHQDKNGQLIIIGAPTIYKYLYSIYGQSLCKYLPSRRYHRKRRKGRKKTRIIIPNRVLIDERPEIIKERKRFGDFEGDTLGRIKSDKKVIAGLVERMSLYVFITKTSGLKYSMDGFKQMLNPHHKIVQSITFDNGVENRRHEELKVATYFCHPYSAWEKPVIENSFGRLRRFVPKKKSLRNFSENDIQGFAEIMNNTPRKCLEFRMPREVFEEQCALQNDTS